MEAQANGFGDNEEPTMPGQPRCPEWGLRILRGIERLDDRMTRLEGKVDRHENHIMRTGVVTGSAATGIVVIVAELLKLFGV